MESERSLEVSDETLCQRVAAGDEAAFDTLLERYQQRAYRIAWSIVRDAEDARDVSQEAFVRVYETAATFAGRARFSTWFYRILVNLCLDHRRRHRWWRSFVTSGEAMPTGDSLLELAVAPARDTVDALDRERTMSRLWDAVQHLSPQQRATLALHVGEDLRAAEIAEILKVSEATVRVHLHRAVTALRKTMRKDRDEPPAP